MPKLAPYSECTGCMACVDSCNHRALTSVFNDEGHLVPQLNQNACVECKRCERTCPVVTKLNYSQGQLACAFAAWAKDSNVRKNSATAGVFAAMAQYILSVGGVVCGAAIVDNVNVKHIIVDNILELCRLQGSKYTQSNASGIYKSVYQKINDGAVVLFSGTGCQVAGLYGYIGKRKYSGKLITVDLICGGVPSRFLIDKFIEGELYNVKKILSFRSKDNGWKPKGFRYNLKVEDSDEILHDYTGKRNLITDGFSCEMTNRYSCYECKFTGIHRMADFTIGDYWGIKDYHEQHRGGVSCVIAHNESAVKFLEEIKKYLEVYPANVKDIVAFNHRLVQGHDGRYRMLERKYLAYFFKHLNYKTLCKIYALQFEKMSPWILYKVYRKIIAKILK